MINFSFAVLGSVTFWVVYLVVSAFVTTAVLRTIAKKTFSFITGGDVHKTKSCCVDDMHPYVGYIVIVLFNFVFWPIILPVTIIAFIVSKVFYPALFAIRKVVIAINKMLPTVKFVEKEER